MPRNKTNGDDFSGVKLPDTSTDLFDSFGPTLGHSITGVHFGGGGGGGGGGKKKKGRGKKGGGKRRAKARTKKGKAKRRRR